MIMFKWIDGILDKLAGVGTPMTPEEMGFPPFELSHKDHMTECLECKRHYL